MYQTVMDDLGKCMLTFDGLSRNPSVPKQNREEARECAALIHNLTMIIQVRTNLTVLLVLFIHPPFSGLTLIST
jgi:hypothetical protein